MPEPLDNLARELRSAVLASDHEKATRLVAEYAEALGRHWTALTRDRTRRFAPTQTIPRTPQLGPQNDSDAAGHGLRKPVGR